MSEQLLQEELERRVEERTAELSRVNAELVREIAERRRAEEALADSEHHLRQAHKMEVIGRLTGGVAHDFNNLLTVILTQASVLRAPPGDEARVSRAAEAIVDASRRAANLTRQLLTFSRQQVLTPRDLDVAAVITDVAPMLGRVIGEHIDLQIAAGDAAWIHADPGQIEQVILNLVVNARDAMPDGGQLAVALGREGPHVVLSVRDTGVGMDAATQAHIFEPFFTTKASGRGTGLGLATVHGIATQSGGGVRVHSEPGRGALFEVWFPEVAPTIRAASDRTPTPAPVVADETLLLVEDDGLVRKAVALSLRSAGYTVLEAHHGAEALRVLERHTGTIHGIVSDVVMPGMNGREMVRQARERRPGLPVLYITGYAPAGPMESIGAREAFLAKPFEPAVLARCVRELLDADA